MASYIPRNTRPGAPPSYDWETGTPIPLPEDQTSWPPIDIPYVPRPPSPLEWAKKKMAVNNAVRMGPGVIQRADVHPWDNSYKGGNWTPTDTMRPDAAEKPEDAPGDPATDLPVTDIKRGDPYGAEGGLAAIAHNMAPSASNDLSRFGFAMAAGDSPFIGVNVGRAGLAMMEGQDKGNERYFNAMSELAKIHEIHRANVADEANKSALLPYYQSEIDLNNARIDALGRGVKLNPAANYYINTKKAAYLDERKAIMTDVSLAPEEKAAKVQELDKQWNLFIADALKRYGAPEDDSNPAATTPDTQPFDATK